MSINPRFNKLITSLRTAVEGGLGNLDKEATIRFGRYLWSVTLLGGSHIYPHHYLFFDTYYGRVRLLRYRDQHLKMSDVHRTQASGANQSQAEPSDMLVVSELGVRSQNKAILEEISFKVKKGTSLAIVGPNGGGKTTLFRALLNLIPYTGMIRWNDEIKMGYVPQSLVSTDFPISVAEFLRFKCRTDLEACIRSVGLEKEISDRALDLFQEETPACSDRLGYR